MWVILMIDISLSTLILNSRDRYEKNGNRILCAWKHALELVIFEKSSLK